MDVYNPSNLNRVKEHEVTAVSFAHSRRDSSNTMQLVDLVEILGGKDCVCAVMAGLVIKANKAISRLRNIHYRMTLSPEDELAINQDIFGFVRRKLLRGM